MKALLGSDAMGVLWRIVAATLMGYLFAMVACLWLTHFLVLPVREARLLTNMMFFVLYALAVLWVFFPQSHLTAVVGISGATLVLWIFWRLAERAAS